MKTLVYSTKTKSFSVKLFSDWDQIRDLVNSQLPKGVIRVEKVRSSETKNSYKVKPIYHGNHPGKEVEIPINGKSALDNYNKATNSKVENIAKPKLSEEDKKDYKLIKLGYTRDQIELIKKADSKDFKVRNYVAENSNTPKEVLEKLANDENGYVRYRVADNSNTSKEVLEKLANDENGYVRYHVANNSNTPKEVLEKLANDEDAEVKSSVAGNPNTPEKILEKLANDENWKIRSHVAINPSTPKEILEKLANDEDHDVRYSVANNQITPKEILEKLVNDENGLVRNAAQSMLNS